MNTIKETLLVMLLPALILGWLVHLGAQERAKEIHPVQMYWERPDCSHPVSFVLGASWRFPLEKGIEVWICR